MSDTYWYADPDGDRLDVKPSDHHSGWARVSNRADATGYRVEVDVPPAEIERTARALYDAAGLDWPLDTARTRNEAAVADLSAKVDELARIVKGQAKEIREMDERYARVTTQIGNRVGHVADSAHRSHTRLGGLDKRMDGLVLEFTEESRRVNAHHRLIELEKKVTGESRWVNAHHRLAELEKRVTENQPDTVVTQHMSAQATAIISHMREVENRFSAALASATSDLGGCLSALGDGLGQIHEAVRKAKPCGASSPASNAVGDERCTLPAGHGGRHKDGLVSFPRQCESVWQHGDVRCALVLSHFGSHRDHRDDRFANQVWGPDEVAAPDMDEVTDAGGHTD